MPAIPFVLSLSKGLAAAAALSCTAIDGDTLRCGPAGQESERIRLIGIDAPELPGHCRQGRDCAPGDPWASKAALARLVRGRAVRIERFGTDLYGRTLALVWAGGKNLGCEQLRTGMAIYVPRWDYAGLKGRCG